MVGISKKLTVGFLLFLVFSCEKEAAQLSEREFAIQDYVNNYLGSTISDPGWTGDIASCNAGTVPESTHDKVLQRINYFRRLVGLNDNITWDRTKFECYQQAALMQSANNDLNHYPPPTWNCYTDEGYAGSSSSNLTTASGSFAITSFIIDQGDHNVDVAHRRWLLHSTKSQFSYGMTSNRMSLGVFGWNENSQPLPPFIAYPPDGFIPYQLVWPRWSFGIPGADFSAANVTMQGPNGDLVCDVISTQNGYGDNTIVWEPQNFPFGAQEANYIVTVSSVGNAPQATYVYQVKIVDSGM